MAKDKTKKKFMPRAHYSGGTRAMASFIKTNLRYPKEALEHRIEGVVRLRISIDYKGKVTGHEIMMSLGYGCDEEAWRVVSQLNFEVDQMVRKGKVQFHKTLNIHFTLPKKKVAIPRYQYHFVSSPTKKKTYSYVIQID